MGSNRERWVNNASIGVQPARDQFQTNTELVKWNTEHSYIYLTSNLLTYTKNPTGDEICSVL